MATQGLPDSATPEPARNGSDVQWQRSLLGSIAGLGVGGLIGWLIDSALTAEPYAGIGIGLFLGGLLGSVGAGGARWKGIGMVLSMVIFSAAGTGVAIALRNFGPDNIPMFVPLAIGGIAGAFAGLILAAAVINRRQRRSGAKAPDHAE